MNGNFGFGNFGNGFGNRNFGNGNRNGNRNFGNGNDMVIANNRFIPAPPLYPPQLRLYTTKFVDGSGQRCGMTPCSMPSCDERVRGDFPPIFCHHHRNNQEPISGFAYLHRDEARILNITRRHGWMSKIKVMLTEMSVEAAMQNLDRDTRNLRLNNVAFEQRPPAAYRDRHEDRFEELDDSDAASDMSSLIDDWEL
jgi:hypothetical protein